MEKRLREQKKPVDKPEPAGPIANVHGKVKDIKEGVVTIDIGSDADLKQGDVLQVYRLDPDPKKSLYLGTLKVLSVRPKEAVGQITLKAKKLELKIGDEVSSSIGRDGQ
jgi:hypothetical protein